ncbi:MAG TPA: hypothetical protein VK066_28450 [Chloroflexota bacterium]|nr:hypothetical protein [Chloroflexota bacterium]
MGITDGELSPAPDPRSPSPYTWRLAPGVSLLAGTLVGGDQSGVQVYALVLPNGQRFQVSEPLYRLAELLRSRLPPEEIAARLSARLGRPLGVAEVASLVATRLAPRGVVADAGPVLEQ